MNVNNPSPAALEALIHLDSRGLTGGVRNLCSHAALLVFLVGGEAVCVFFSMQRSKGHGAVS